MSSRRLDELEATYDHRAKVEELLREIAENTKPKPDAPEKALPACVLHEEIVRDGPSKWSCEIHPEPGFGLDSGGEPVLRVCRNCGNLTSKPHLRLSNKTLCPQWTCTRPEPEQVEPGEMPEAVGDAIEAITDAYNETDEMYGCAYALRDWWRAHAQPPSPRPKLAKVRLALQLTSRWALNANERLVIVAALAELDRVEGKP